MSRKLSYMGPVAMIFGVDPAVIGDTPRCAAALAAIWYRHGLSYEDVAARSHISRHAYEQILEAAGCPEKKIPVPPALVASHA